jgi:hypothetical protein
MGAPIAAARPHVAAVKSMLEDGATALGITASGAYTAYLTRVDGDVAPIYPYWVLHPDPGIRSAERITAAPDRLDQTLQITSVGRDYDEVMAAVETALELLLNRRPAVPGRSTWRLRQLSGTPERPLVDRTALDPATSRPLLYLPVLLGVASTPAPTS